MNAYLTIALLLVAHFVGDFVLQTHRMSTGKSKDNGILVAHVLIYSVTLAAATAWFAWQISIATWATFVGINFAAHFATDYCTSRWTSRLFRASFFFDAKMTDGPLWPPREEPIHDFFVVIGLDQLIHGLTLLGTAWLLLSEKV